MKKKPEIRCLKETRCLKMTPDIRLTPENHTKLGDFSSYLKENLNLAKNYPKKLGVIFMGSYPKKMLDIRCP